MTRRDLRHGWPTIADVTYRYTSSPWPSIIVAVVFVVVAVVAWRWAFGG